MPLPSNTSEAARVRVNYKRMKRLYQHQGLKIRRRKRKNVPVGERHPLLGPASTDHVWSMDFCLVARQIAASSSAW